MLFFTILYIYIHILKIGIKRKLTLILNLIGVNITEKKKTENNTITLKIINIKKSPKSIVFMDIC